MYFYEKSVILKMILSRIAFGGVLMERNVAIGIQNYSTLIEKNYFYVDKTSFIKESRLPTKY